jgi:hypothetical protein
MQTKYPFNWENLKGGIMCFPVAMPIGLTTPFMWVALLILAIFYFIAFIWSTYEECGGIKKWPFWLSIFRVFLFFWCLAICDYAYWDIADAHVSPNMNYTFMYQQMQHSSIGYGKMAVAGKFLVFLNILVLAVHFWLVRSGLGLRDKPDSQKVQLATE